MRVLVAGGGIAALEAVLALHELAGHLLSVTLLAPEPELLYRPVTIAEAFGRAEARSYSLDEMLTDKHVVHVRGSLAQVDAAGHAVLTAAGERIPFDVLVLALGARATPPLPGALTFGGRADVPALRALLDELVDGAAGSVAFALAQRNAWPLPLYELALMTAAHLREHGSTAAVLIVTPEAEPLDLFGPAAADALRPAFEALHIWTRCAALPVRVEGDELVLAGAGTVRADRVVTLPRSEGPRVSGVPADGQGFIPVDKHGRVAGLDDVYAAGDLTSFPLKQGGLAAQQADAVAEAISARAGAGLTPSPFRPVLRGLMMTAGAPLYLRSEPHLLERPATVAIDAPRLHARRPAMAASAASDQPLWWPPAKVAGRYLAPFLATARRSSLAPEVLVDRIPLTGPPVAEAERHDALELMLLLADGDAGWGDYRSALRALAAAEALEGALPSEYETKRRLWMSELSLGGRSQA
jgi:sulfide:quinone oxidoreductase